MNIASQSVLIPPQSIGTAVTSICLALVAPNTSRDDMAGRPFNALDCGKQPPWLAPGVATISPEREYEVVGCVVLSVLLLVVRTHVDDVQSRGCGLTRLCREYAVA